MSSKNNKAKNLKSTPVTAGDLQEQLKDVDSFKLLKKLGRYVWRYKMGLVLAVMGMIGYAVVDTGFVYQIKPLIDDGLTNHDADVLFWIPFMVMGIVCLRGVCHFLSEYFMSWVGAHVVLDLQRDVFARLLQLPRSYFDKRSSGELIAKITYDASQVNSAASSSLVALVREGATVIGLLGLMFFQSWKLSLIFLVVGPIVGILIGFISRKFRKVSRNIQGAMGTITSAIEQMLRGRTEIIMFRGQKEEQERFEKVSEEVRRQNMRLVRVSAIGAPVVQICASSGLALLLALATQPQILEEISTGTFTMMVTSLMMLLKPLKSLMQVNNNFQRGVAACQSLFGVIEEPAEKDNGTLKVATEVKSGLEFKDVSFTYPGADKPALNKLNFVLEPGKSMALVGRSGSGKSTVAALIARLYDVTAGEIFYNGHNICDYTLTSLRSSVAFVSQNVHIFNASVAANIAYAAEDKFTRAQIEEAARWAGADSFIQALDNGYDTVLDENGSNLSGGQRQRIAIARALLRRASLLVLDEATSALDNESEKVVKYALSSLPYKCSVILIAHRLSTIKDVDNIVVMDNGSVFESGSHDELMARQGMYYYLNKQVEE